MAAFNIGYELVKLLKSSQTTVLKLYQLVHNKKDVDKKEFQRFRQTLIRAVRHKKENALTLFPIIKYLLNKITPIDQQYSDVLFSVKTDLKIALASPIVEQEQLPANFAYDLRIFWDRVELQERESQFFKAATNYFKIIKKDKKLTDFINFLGQFQEENWLFLENEKEIFTEGVPQEVFALHQSGDINNLLASEIVQLDDIDLELVFLKNFVEKKLLSYQLWGLEREIYEEWIITKRFRDEKGPLFLCLDTSGSMRGLNEIVSKALVLFFIDFFDKNGINFVFVPFSTQAQFYDFDHQKEKFKECSLLLKKSFYGGSDVKALFLELTKRIKHHKYVNTNILLVSDFIFKNTNDTIIQQIKVLKSQHHKIHSLNVGNKKFQNKLLAHFNSNWSYYYS